MVRASRYYGSRSDKYLVKRYTLRRYTYQNTEASDQLPSSESHCCRSDMSLFGMMKQGHCIVVDFATK